MVLWNDWRTGSHDIYAQRFMGDLPVPTLMSLVSFEATPDRTRLVWQARGAAGRSFEVERCEPGGGWAPRARGTARDDGQLVYEDHEVSPGSRYGYRIREVDEDLREFSAETWIDVPKAFPFAFQLAGGNPVSGDLVTAISLPEARRAAIQVFDVSGRAILSQDFGILPAGRHVRTVAPESTLRPGIAFLRLQAGADTRVLKIAIAR